MLIKDMYKKPIDRDLQGVIVVGQSEKENLSQELEEYVVTRELQKHFADFFEAYKKGIVGNTNEIGVWISGFFGSGKSHFLKILSLILDNREVDGKKAIDYFVDDNKIAESMVLADMKLAAETPADVILFNVDSKSDSTSKHDKDAIVNVFLKVFNEKLGFCGSIPYLADLEKQLTEKGKYDDFKNSFEDGYGDSWESSRHKFDFIQDDVVDSLAEIGFMSEEAARNWCEKATEDYKISIEDFAKRVKEYIASKGNNHHVVFMVDEIGQYIGDDSRLMLNLQTVREELGKECKGKAWVVVTSQQDIDSITKVKGNDFSKIQGRFATRLALSSANVDEVIKKRLLDKNDTGTDTLKLLYEQKATVIKNLITFNDAVEKKLYDDSENFAAVYPFVPYQFNVLADVLTSIRTHGASGKHLSEGERSMLALFRESAISIKDESEGAIIPFYRFYDTLENFLDHSHKGVISKAYDNTKINPDKKTSDVFAINVLKTLFMIKYIKIVEPNVDNITSLMISNIDDDRISLKDQVEQALKTLQQQMLVQKNGSFYIFLTDEEQEINREIESQNIEMSEVITKVSEMIFEDIFSDKRYRYPAPAGSPEFNGRYTFPFNQFVDDRPYKSNQSYEIGLRILTPWYEGGGDDSKLRMMSGTGREVLVLLPDDTGFLDEMMTYLKIEKFLRMNTSTQVVKYESIKESKRGEMRERNNNAKLYLTESLKEGRIYANGDEIKVASKEVSGRINEALGKIVQNVYHKLSYIDTVKDEVEVREMLKSSSQIRLDEGESLEPNAHAQDDLLAFVKGNSDIHMKTSMKTIKDRFMAAPYGFVESDIDWLVARLFKKGDLAFTVSSSPVNLINKNGDEIADYITKKQYVDKLLMEIKTRVNEKDKKAVKTVIKEVFSASIINDDEDAMMNAFQRYSATRVLEMEKLEINYQHYAYPGKKVIEVGKKLLKPVADMQDVKEFYEYVSKHQDDFLDYADDYIPVKKFFEGEQQQFFMRALDMMEIYDDSRTYIVDKNLEDIVAQIKAIVKKDVPYSDIPKLPALRDQFMTAYSEILKKESEPVMQSITDARERVVEVVDTKEYAEEKKPKYIELFVEISNGANTCNNVSSLRSYADKADALKLRLLNEMDALDADIARKRAEESKGSESGDVDFKVKVPIKTTKNIAIKDVTHTSSWRIESLEDVDKYVVALSKSLKDAIGKEDVDVINVEF